MGTLRSELPGWVGLAVLLGGLRVWGPAAVGRWPCRTAAMRPALAMGSPQAALGWCSGPARLWHRRPGVGPVRGLLARLCHGAARALSRMRTCAFRTPPAVLWLCVATQACCRPLLWGLARWGFAVRVFGVGCGVALGGLWGAMLGGWHSGAPGRMRRCAFRQVSQRPVHRQRPPQCFPIRFGPSLRPRLALGVPCSQPFSRRFHPRKGLPTGDWTRFCKLPVKLA